MVEDDIASLAELYKQFWEEESSISRMGSIFRNLNGNADYLILSAVENNRVIGSIMGIICHELYGNCSPFMVVENFIVDSGSRRKGIGRALFHEVEKYAVQQGCSQVLLVTENNRKDAIAFYIKMGFDPDCSKGFKKKLKS